MKKLKTLARHNQEVRDAMNNPNKNGIACPNCGSELDDVGRGILLSNPPQMEVKCFNCGYTGYRLYNGY